MIAYHGTAVENVSSILAKGLKADRADGFPCVWLALDFWEAAEREAVIEIDLSEIGEGSWPLDENGELDWQCHYDADIPPQAIRAVWLDMHREDGVRGFWRYPQATRASRVGRLQEEVQDG